jgi:pyruvate dehydrogenase E2 component (dihydrolipoamide acetyltransferase)
MREIIARRMTQSLSEMAQLTLFRSVDATKLSVVRSEYDEQSRPTLNALLLAAVARALVEHPAVNATLEEGVISRWGAAHIGMAVAVDDGLVVPVIRRAESLTLRALQQEADRLAERARGSRLTMSELVGGTFTVSNLGGLGIDGFTPIINPPQVAILGIGRVYRDAMTLSLTIDHRALDGAPGARFLDTLAALLERPQSWI